MAFMKTNSTTDFHVVSDADEKAKAVKTAAAKKCCGQPGSPECPNPACEGETPAPEAPTA